MRRRGDDWIVSISIAGLIVIAAITGKKLTEQSDQTLFTELLSMGHSSVAVNNNKWLLKDIDGNNSSILYQGEGKGYNDNIMVVTLSDTLGNIISVQCVREKETPSFFRKVLNNNYLGRFSNHNINDFIDGSPVDIITGATISSMAIAEAVKDGYIRGENIRLYEPFDFNFGFPEIIVSVLLILSLLMTVKVFQRFRKILLPISWILSMLLLGFFLGQPLTLPRFITIFSGYLPDLGGELYIILIALFAVAAVLFGGKNLYCKSVCPFGATQEIIGAIGNASEYRPARFRIFKYLQWGITLAAVLLALFMNNPGLAEYSVFGAFFQLTAASIIFILLLITILLSLFVKRPWCNFLCPVDGVFAYFRTLRRAILTVFR